MINASVRSVKRLVDRVAYNITAPADLSHLVDVRSLRGYEVDTVADKLNPARNATTHHGRLKLQEDGMLIYLIAWISDTPVGHGMLLWDGPTGMPKQYVDRPCPYVEDLWVRSDMRSRGIGARILAEITILVISHGYDAVSLSVGVENRRAIELYERLGFTIAPIPRFRLSGMVAMANGETQFWSEKCQYMLKSLNFREDREVEIA